MAVLALLARLPTSLNWYAWQRVLHALSGLTADHLALLVQTTYDGVGRLLKEFRKSNFTEVTRLAAQRFIVILPIAPYYRDGSTTLLNKHYDPLVSVQ